MSAGKVRGLPGQVMTSRTRPPWSPFGGAICPTSRDGAHADLAPLLQMNFSIWEKEDTCLPSHHPDYTTWR